MRALDAFGMLRWFLVAALGLWLLAMPRTSAAQDIVDDECFDVTGNTGCDVEGVSDIMATTDAVEIDTFVATYINDFTLLDAGYAAYVEGFLIDSAGQLSDSTSANDDGSGAAIAQMFDPIVYSSHGYVLDDVYQLEGNHYLIDFSGVPNPIGASGVIVPLGAPTITGINGTDYGFVGTSGSVTIQGIDLVDPFTFSATASPSSGTGLLVAVAGVSGDPFGTEFLDVAYSIAQCASTGPRFIVISNEFGSDSGDWSFTVGDPPPLITGVNPSLWKAGNSYTVTVYGTGFGTSPTLTIVGNGVSLVAVNSVSDTQISANISISASAPQQTATVTVQSNGYCGSGFQPAYPGEPFLSSIGVFVVPAPATPPQIQLYVNNNITNTTQSMVVGQEIALSAVVTLPAGMQICSQQWNQGQSLPGSVIGGYTATPGNGAPENTGPGGSAQVTPAPGTAGGSALSSSTCTTTPLSITFYWVGAGTNMQITYTYTRNDGASSSASAIFNVTAPTNIGMSVTASPVVTIRPPGLQFKTGQNVQTTTTPTMIYKPASGTQGIRLMVSSTPPSGNNGAYKWAQLINCDDTEWISPNAANPPGRNPVSPSVSGCNPAAPTPNSSAQLDGGFPYGTYYTNCPGGCPVGAVTMTTVANDTATDAPQSNLLNGLGEYARFFNATMYSLWSPTADTRCTDNNCTIPIPLGSVNWQFTGDAINTLTTQQVQVNQQLVLYPLWIMNSGPVVTGTFQPSNFSQNPASAFPTWAAVDSPL